MKKRLLPIPNLSEESSPRDEKTVDFSSALSCAAKHDLYAVDVHDDIACIERLSIGYLLGPMGRVDNQVK